MHLEPNNILIMTPLVIALFGWFYYRNRQQVMQARKAIFSDCYKLLNKAQSQPDRAGFVSLTGQLQGVNASMAIEVDNLTPRKLPVMWLHLTVVRENAVPGTLDILARPNNTEFFSPSWEWSQTVRPLTGWPDHARYMTRDVPPQLSAIDNDVKTLFADKRTKALLITPQYLRLTYMLRQGDRGHYLLLRAADFDYSPIDADEIAALIRQLKHLQDNLQEVCDEAA